MHYLKTPSPRARGSRTLTLAALLAGLGLAALPVTAQEAAKAENEGEQAATSPTVYKLEQFAVTGSVSPRKLLESPISITTVDRSKIDEIAPRSTAELLKIMPGLYTESSGGEGLQNVLVRGIELSGAYTYIVLSEDGLPVTSESTLRYSAADQYTRQSLMVASVEALRGGSANIFATNASQALINFISREGGPNLAGEWAFTTSSYGTIKNEMWLSGPAGKNTTFAVGGWYRVDNGIRDPGFAYPNRGGQIMGNVKHTFENGKGFIKVSAKALDDHNIFDVPLPMQNAYNPTSIPFGPNIRTDPTTSSEDDRRVILGSSPAGPINWDNANGVHSKMAYIGAELDYQLSDSLKLQNKFRYTSIDRSIDYYLNGVATPWQTLANTQAKKDATQFAAAKDASGNYQFQLAYPGQGGVVAAANPAAAAALLNGYGIVKTFDHAYGPITDFQEDLRLIQTLANEKVHFTVGLYTSSLNNSLAKQFDQVLTDVTPQYRRVDINFVNATTGQVIAPGTYNGVYQYGATYTNDTSYEREVSPYVEVEGKFGKLNVDAGLRHHTVKENANIELTSAYNINTATTGNNPALQKATFGNGNYVTDPLNINANVWTVGANYTFTPHFSFFARYSDDARFISLTDLTENYHSGRVGAAGNPTNHIKQMEAGIKYGARNYALFVTAFHIALTDVFQNQVIVDPITQAQSTSASFQNNTSDGVEIEGQWTPIRGLSLGINATFDHSILTDNNTEKQTLLNGTTVLINDNGLVPARTPKVYGNVSAAYRFPATQMGTFSVNASYQYTGERFSDLANSNPTPLKAFGEAVIGASFATKNGFTMRLEVNNAFNTLGFTEGDPRTGNAILDPSAKSFNARPNLPRTIQGSVSYKF